MAEQQAICQCGQKIRASNKLAGKTVKCPKCAQPVRIPTASDDQRQAIKAKCECGATIAVKAALAGKRVKCPKCEQPIRIPSVTAQPPAAGNPVSPDAGASRAGGVVGLLDEVGLEESAGRCPECRTELSPGQRICLHCGFDFDRGKKINVKKFLEEDRYSPYRGVKGDPNANQRVALHPKVISMHRMMSLLAWWYVLVTVLFVAFSFVPPELLQSEADDAQQTLNQTLAIGLYGGLAAACLYAAGQFKRGRHKGRTMCIGLAVLSLLFGLPCGSICSVLILVWAFSYEVTEHCR